MPTPLPSLPATFPATRLALHRLAVYVLAPARRAATGRIGLRPSPGGFATPLFGVDPHTVVGVDGTDLVVVRDGDERRTPIGSLTGAARAVGVALDLEAAARFDVPPAGDVDAPLDPDRAAVAALAAWYGFGAVVLDDLLATTDPDDRPSLVQLWPEHFDVAIDLGRHDTGARASWGASPGDAAHDEPYLYVSPWSARADDRVWDDTSFGGASLPYAALLGVPDPRGAAATFFARCRRALAR